MTIISGIILLGLLGFSGYKELNARRKRAKIYSLEKKICEEPVYVLKDDKLIPYKEGMVIGSGATAISLYELYSVSEDHEQVLNVLSERFPNKFPEDTSLIDFISDFAEKIEKGEASVQGLVSGITGELGEMAAVDYLNQLPELKEHGIQAVQFVSKTHKGTDLRFEYADGSPAPVEVVPGANGETMVKVVDSKREVFEQIQVKSYTVDNMDNFMADVRTNPDVDNYIVNKELFAALKENGKLDVLNSHGVNVVPGDWSHAAHVEEASALFNHVEEGLDIAEDIPLVALAFFGYKAVANIKDYTRGAATGEECRTKITADAIRIPVAGGTGFVGAKAGAYIGTIINPGIGTVIGGGVGAIVGAIGGSSLVRCLRDKFMYGKIIEIIDKYGSRVYNRDSELITTIEENISSNVYHADQLMLQAYEAGNLADRYDAELDPYHSAEASVPAVLSNIHYRNLIHEHTIREKASRSIVDALKGTFSHIVDAKQRVRMLGDLILGNADTLGVSGAEVILYRHEIKKYPNHPYVIKGENGTINPKDVLATVCQEQYEKAHEKVQEDTIVSNRTTNIYQVMFWGALLVTVGLLGYQLL